MSAAAPAPMPAPPVLSPRVTPSIRSMLAPAWTAAPAPMPAPWAPSARAESKDLHENSAGACAPALFLYYGVEEEILKEPGRKIAAKETQEGCLSLLVTRSQRRFEKIEKNSAVCERRNFEPGASGNFQKFSETPLDCKPP